MLDSLSDLPLARKLTEGEIDFEAEGARAVAAVVTGKDNCVRALRDPETPRFLRFVQLLEINASTSFDRFPSLSIPLRSS